MRGFGHRIAQATILDPHHFAGRTEDELATLERLIS